MAPNRAELREALAAGRPPVASDAPGRALATLRDATQAAMMMAMVWPIVASMPFFWAPPFWIMAGLGAAPLPPNRRVVNGTASR